MFPVLSWKERKGKKKTLYGSHFYPSCHQDWIYHFMKNENVELLTQKLLRIPQWQRHGTKSETPPGRGPRTQEAGPA